MQPGVTPPPKQNKRTDRELRLTTDSVLPTTSHHGSYLLFVVAEQLETVRLARLVRPQTVGLLEQLFKGEFFHGGAERPGGGEMLVFRVCVSGEVPGTTTEPCHLEKLESPTGAKSPHSGLSGAHKKVLTARPTQGDSLCGPAHPPALICLFLAHGCLLSHQQASSLPRLFHGGPRKGTELLASLHLPLTARPL